MLKHLGCEAIGAADGAEALEIFRRRRDEFRCVLCDLTMPGMNGWETLAALRQIRQDIPVILCSGYDEARVMAAQRDQRPQAFPGQTL
jgi:two-component system, cell cycle sensor histidine kinase and response regulator CckA